MIKATNHAKDQMARIRLVLQWVIDLTSGEMITSPTYNREWITFDDAANVELRECCVLVNIMLEALGVKMHVEMCTCGDRIVVVKA